MRLDKALSLNVIPHLGRSIARSIGGRFGEDLVDILQHCGPLLNLHSLTFQSSPWAEGLSEYLPHLVNLDISRVHINVHVLAKVIECLGNSLRKLILDGLQICRWTTSAILNCRYLEHLSLVMCRFTPGALEWFLAGFPIPPACHQLHGPVNPQLLSGHCYSPDSTFVRCAGTEMPCLKELDLKYLNVLKTRWLRQFHLVRLALSEGQDSSMSEDPNASGSSSLTRAIHIDVRGCKNLSLADLQGMETSWPGTWFTPSLKALGQDGSPHSAATPLPEHAIPFALQVPGAIIGHT